MKLLKRLYEKRYNKPAPYYFDYSPLTIVMKPIRKWLTNSLAANCPFNCIRIAIYRLCGFSIGKGTFIGMRCYLDDMCYDLMKIGRNCTISYGVFFSCHGRNQGHVPIEVGDGAYIGMRASIIARQDLEIGENAIVGTMALVNKTVPANSIAMGVPICIKENTKVTKEC